MCDQKRILGSLEIENKNDTQSTISLFLGRSKTKTKKQVMAAENLLSLVTHGGHGCWKINELNWTSGLLPRVTSECIDYRWLQR